MEKISFNFILQYYYTNGFSWGYQNILENGSQLLLTWTWSTNGSTQNFSSISSTINAIDFGEFITAFQLIDYLVYVRKKTINLDNHNVTLKHDPRNEHLFILFYKDI